MRKTAVERLSGSVRPHRWLLTLPKTISQLFLAPPAPESTVTAKGHIRAVRAFKNVGFLDLSDGSGPHSLNVVFEHPERVLGNFRVGQSVSVIGRWVESKGTQAFDLVYDIDEAGHSLQVVGDVPETYPIQKKSMTYQFLRQWPVLRHRTALLALVLRFRSQMETAFGAFFAENGFTKVSPPLITGSDCEGAGEQFTVERRAERKGIELEIGSKGPQKEGLDEVQSLSNEPQSDGSRGSMLEPKNGAKPPFFGKNAYLTVSTQLHLEALALSLNRAWTLTPCFRAEDSNTNRHLSEFWMLEAELCYVENVQELTDFTEAMIRSVARSLSTENVISGGLFDLTASRFEKKEAETIRGRFKTVLADTKWPSITYAEAIDILNSTKNKGRLKGRLAWGDSILTEHEKWLAGVHFLSPVFITDYPAAQKPFYMPKSSAEVYDSERPTVACFDLILPEIGELVGGSIREHNYEKLVDAMTLQNMNIEEMEWYLSTRQNGSVPHGGFGMGFERLVAYLAAMDNIKDVIPFPRAPETCQC